jgi:release factor glutamine methyltransferase
MPELTVALGTLIQEGAERLRRSGVVDARRQAIRICSDLTDRCPAEVLLDRECPVDVESATRFESAIRRRCLGEPLAHVTGRSGFRRLSLVSDARGLIPRPETEGLVELLLQRVRTGRVVDVGTGSGCIALSLAQEGGFSEVVGIDRSAEALSLAALNRNLSGIDVALVLGDWCGPLRAGAFDALVSNPPYLTEAEYASLEPSVRDWEPGLALVSGEDGMAATARLLDDARHVLRAGGWLVLEVDCSRAATAAERAAAYGWSDVAVHMDLFGRERYLLARRSNTR